MEPWFLREPARLKLERAAVEALAGSGSWLIGAVWRFDPDLCLDAVIRAHGHDYECRVTYPSFYPDVPAVVRPRGAESRLTLHQYGGADGPLCLEWGPDNWQREITTADLLSSAHRLFELENPLGDNRRDVPVAAPSRHLLTLGQSLRFEFLRWYESGALRGVCDRLPRGGSGTFQFSLRAFEESSTVVVHGLCTADAGDWTDPSIPGHLSGPLEPEQRPGVWVRTELSAFAIERLTNWEELLGILSATERAELLESELALAEALNRRAALGLMVIDQDGAPHLFLRFEDNRVHLCAKSISGSEREGRRTPPTADLTGKDCAVVGVGAAGSKIALMLARMGASRLVLVDQDVLLPENLVRHVLDWRDVTRHKARAVADAVRNVRAGIEVRPINLHLTGQESSAALDVATRAIGDCDLIVDATANPNAFNLLAALSKHSGKAMVWLEIFAGGVGGLVARSRPGLDPEPKEMRTAYMRYCEANPAPDYMIAAEDYSIASGDQIVLEASDADVGVIASHATSLAADSLLAPHDSRYPCSMYLVGLAAAWVFRQPFDTIPLACTPSEGPSVSHEMSADDRDFLLRLLAKQRDETPSA